MNLEQMTIIRHLHDSVTMLPGTWDKRFVRQMFYSKPSFKITDKQNEWIYRLLYKYRKQLPELYEKHKENEFCKKK